MIRTVDEINAERRPLYAEDHQAAERIALRRHATTAINAPRAIGEELDELEAMAAALLRLRNNLRAKADGLYTGTQVGDFQTSEAELVSTALRRDLERTRREHAEAMAADHQTIVEQRERIAELERQRDRAQETARHHEGRIHALAADIGRLHAEMGRRYTMAQVEDVRAEARAEGLAAGREGAEALLRKALDRLSHLEDPTLILDISNYLGSTGARSPGA